MIGYSPMVGKHVEVVYRLGTMHLVVAGLLLADSEESVFVEQHLDQNGPVKTFHLKIPHHCIVRLSEINPDPTPTLT